MGAAVLARGGMRRCDDSDCVLTTPGTGRRCDDTGTSGVMTLLDLAPRDNTYRAPSGV